MFTLAFCLPIRTGTANAHTMRSATSLWQSAQVLLRIVKRTQGAWPRSRSAAKLIVLNITSLFWLGCALLFGFLAASCLNLVWLPIDPGETTAGAFFYTITLPAFTFATLLLLTIVYWLFESQRWIWGVAMIASAIPIPLLPIHLPPSTPKWLAYTLLIICSGIHLISGGRLIWKAAHQWWSQLYRDIRRQAD